ncbi:DNA internalization-related competence protein ComEC/Rec2 [Halalkalibacillus sediminis]|uniref:DNA internalization-related competence protein ComEC/Rec2 n=1 Tax=Halalkalibacillus sediminis TaxID=2018042 RepID=A0A2I0QXJ4_9BACI|nr:DNA internalization-related competence protein ComEC/Rec2 [Halalkalibacillus sediminis]PKR79052.1 DNA internalization-related competence protein ComEC/Rec2 [Halalkalibacillus sediminis]
MKGRWFFVAVCFLCGYLPDGIAWLAIIGWYLLFIQLLIKKPWIFLLSFCFFISSLYISSTMTTTPIKEDRSVNETFVITTNPTRSDETLEFKAKKISTGEVFIFYSDQVNELPKLVHGATCTIDALLKPPKPATNPGQFDYREYLVKKAISGLSYDFNVSHCSDRSGMSYVFELRERIKYHLENTYSSETYSWMNALLLGDQSLIHKETIDHFRLWNLSHILAISGLHVGLIIAIIYAFSQYVLRLSTHQIKLILLMFLPVYIILAGTQPPVIRASLMAIFLILSSYINKKTLTIDIVFIVMIAILIVDRYLIFQMSFQFSFLVTIALILSKNFLIQSHWIWMSLRISLISQLIILPLQFQYFYYTNSLSAIANLVLIPYFTLLIIPFNLLLFLVSFLPKELTDFFDWAFVTLHGNVINAFMKIDAKSWFFWVVGSLPIEVTIIFYVSLLSMFIFWDLNKRRIACFAGVLSIMVILGNQYLPWLDKSFKITMLDLGQADSYVVEFPNRSGIVMIDAGEKLSFSEDDHTSVNYDKVIKPYLWSNGIKTIDALFITHQDNDHNGAAPDLISAFNPYNIFSSTEEVDYVLKGSFHKLQQGDEISFGESKIRVLWPNHSSNLKDENDHSLVLLFQSNGSEVLLTGDISEEVELQLINQYPWLKPDVFQVAHHGSLTSTHSAWLDHLSANHSLISVGQNNLYGHPHPVVLERLQKNGVHVWRTDQMGAIEVELYKGQGTIKPYLP